MHDSWKLTRPATMFWGIKYMMQCIDKPPLSSSHTLSSNSLLLHSTQTAFWQSDTVFQNYFQETGPGVPGLNDVM